MLSRVKRFHWLSFLQGWANIADGLIAVLTLGRIQGRFAVKVGQKVMDRVIDLHYG
jgi:hypothetical protein